MEDIDEESSMGEILESSEDEANQIMIFPQSN